MSFSIKVHSNLLHKNLLLRRHVPCCRLRLILPDRGIWSVILGHASCISILPYKSSTLEKKWSEASRYSIYLLDLVSLFCLSVCLSIFLPNWIITFGDIYGIFLEHSIYIYVSAYGSTLISRKEGFFFLYRWHAIPSKFMIQTNFLLTALKHPVCGNWMTWFLLQRKQYFETCGQPLSDLESGHILWKWRMMAHPR